MEGVIPRTSLRRGNFAQYALITISLIFFSPRRSFCVSHTPAIQVLAQVHTVKESPLNSRFYPAVLQVK